MGKIWGLLRLGTQRVSANRLPGVRPSEKEAHIFDACKRLAVAQVLGSGRP